LGDNIAWVPYIEEFRKKYEIQNLIVTTFYNDLFDGQYENITFRPPGYREDGMSVIIGVGWYQEEDRNMHKIDPRTIPLQKVSSDILDVEYSGEIRPLINKKINPRPTNKKYVCIATESTAGAKYWHYPGGWQRLVNLLKSVGYEVVLIQKEANSLNGVLDLSGDIPIENRVSDLLQCEFFIGLSSGLSWLSWALGVPTVVISGFTDPKLEFFTPYRVHNKNVCNSCWSDVNCAFDRNNWMWCPKEKGFECSKEITFEMVKQKIDLLISDKNIKYL
jgi:autotransporter strand-loop-strand O-heptosyltransferase